MSSEGNSDGRNFCLFCWNVGNPSAERAAKQAGWLRARKEDIYVLTETKRSEGCLFFEKYFKAYGFGVVSSRPESDFGVLIIARSTISEGGFQKHFNYLPSRAVSALVKTPTGPVEIAAMYVPSRDASPEKVARKQRYLSGATAALSKGLPPRRTIFCGDLNILEPNHVPRYPFFQEWEYAFYEHILASGFQDAFRLVAPTTCEYSWVGRTGDGYRYDHCFVSGDMEPMVVNCCYDHSPRLTGLSDHSALILELAN
jgi:exodeoxyribonuclease-3